MKIILLEPEIPQNTGNIGRMAFATGAELVLVGKLGFSLDEKQLRRAGMDYWKELNVTCITLEQFYASITDSYYFISTKGDNIYTHIPAAAEAIVFGSESKGLPKDIYTLYPHKLYRIPMKTGVRSINLATSAGIVAYHIHSLNSFRGLM